MTNNWIWAGSFLVLVFGSIVFGAKAGIESGLEALRHEQAHAEAHGESHDGHGAPHEEGHGDDSHAPKIGHRPKAAAILEAQELGQHGTTHDEAPHRAKGEKAHAEPTQPSTSDEAVAPGRLFTPASDFDIAFSTGKVERLRPKKEQAEATEDTEPPHGSKEHHELEEAEAHH